jgi:hypothetical protein
VTRKWRDNQCPDCKQVPKPDTAGRLSCACPGQTWTGILGIAGTERERALLANKGFTEQRDIKADVYYVEPYSRIIWLFSDGTWRGDKAADNGDSLEAYLNAIPENETLI